MFYQQRFCVDYFHIYVHPGQESQWIEIPQLEHPYPETDTALRATLDTLRARIDAAA